MNNNQNSIKEKINKYFIKGNTKVVENKPNIKVNTTTYSPQRYSKKQLDITKGIQNPAMARAMKALQLSNPFKGV